MTTSEEDKHQNFGIIIRRFLNNPRDRAAFDDFYKLCHRHTVASLYHLSKLGYQIQSRTNDRSADISNLAIDILGYFLSQVKDRPFGHVFKYFERHQVSYEDESNDVQLYHHFTILIRGFTKKSITKLALEEDHQKAVLRRGINDILGRDDFGVDNSGRHPLVYLVKFINCLRTDKETIAFDQLEDIVIQSFNKSVTRVQLCFEVFELLNKYDEYQNRIMRYLLLKTIITVITSHAEYDSWRSTDYHSVEDVITSKAIDRAIEKSIRQIAGNEIRGYVKKGRLLEEEIKPILTAISNYLHDLFDNHEPDLIPQYFYDVMPSEKHSSYLSDYKYVFETLIKNAKEYFKKFYDE